MIFWQDMPVVCAALQNFSAEAGEGTGIKPCATDQRSLLIIIFGSKSRRLFSYFRKGNMHEQPD
jgi:hypothetical protein